MIWQCRQQQSRKGINEILNGRAFGSATYSLHDCAPTYNLHIDIIHDFRKFTIMVQISSWDLIWTWPLPAPPLLNLPAVHGVDTRTERKGCPEAIVWLLIVTAKCRWSRCLEWSQFNYASSKSNTLAHLGARCPSARTCHGWSRSGTFDRAALAQRKQKQHLSMNVHLCATHM